MNNGLEECRRFRSSNLSEKSVDFSQEATGKIVFQSTVSTISVMCSLSHRNEFLLIS
jgi:hypothetical protein